MAPQENSCHKKAPLSPRSGGRSPRGPGVGLKEDKQSLYPFFQNGAREISCEIVPMYSIDTQHEKAPRFREL